MSNVTVGQFDRDAKLVAVLKFESVEAARQHGVENGAGDGYFDFLEMPVTPLLRVAQWDLNDPVSDSFRMVAVHTVETNAYDNEVLDAFMDRYDPEGDTYYFEIVERIDPAMCEDE